MGHVFSAFVVGFTLHVIMMFMLWNALLGILDSVRLINKEMAQTQEYVDQIQKAVSKSGFLRDELIEIRTAIERS